MQSKIRQAKPGSITRTVRLTNYEIVEKAGWRSEPWIAVLAISSVNIAKSGVESRRNIEMLYPEGGV